MHAPVFTHSVSSTTDRRIDNMLHHLLTLLLATAALARTVEEARSTEDALFGDLKVAYETYRECSGGELTNCLKMKLAKALNRVQKSDEISLLSGVTLVKDKTSSNEPEQQNVEELPRAMLEKDGALDNLILDKLFGFMQSHTLQVKFPAGSELQRAFDEGRSRRRRLMPLLIIPLLIGGMMVPLAFGALALLAGKALIVSKLALVLAGIIGLKKLLSPSGGGHESHEVVVSAGHGGSGWSRAFEGAQDMAYSAYKQ